MTNLEIEAFLAVVRLGSITAAAQAIFITQPALSRRLQTLEEELGYPLFRRGKGQRNIQLTEEGKAFVPVAERWRQLWRQSREIAGLSHRGKMTVAVIGSINTYLMPPVYRCFLRRFPGSSLAVTDQHSVAVYDLVASGQADLGLISDDRYVKQVDTVPLFKEKMVLVSGEDAVFPEDLSWIRPGNCGCLGTRNTTAGTIIGLAGHNRMYTSTRWRCWKILSGIVIVGFCCRRL